MSSASMSGVDSSSLKLSSHCSFTNMEEKMEEASAVELEKSKRYYIFRTYFVCGVIK